MIQWFQLTIVPISNVSSSSHYDDEREMQTLIKLNLIRLSSEILPSLRCRITYIISAIINKTEKGNLKKKREIA